MPRGRQQAHGPAGIRLSRRCALAMPKWRGGQNRVDIERGKIVMVVEP